MTEYSFLGELTRLTTAFDDAQLHMEIWLILEGIADSNKLILH